MKFELIFATPFTDNPIEDWAIWVLSGKDEGNFMPNEMETFLSFFQNDQKLDRELKRLAKNPKKYENIDFSEANLPLLRIDIQREAEKLKDLIWPNIVAQLGSSEFKKITSNHLSLLRRLFEPLEYRPQKKEYRIKGKTLGIKNGLVRIYGIEVFPNKYLLTGWGLKATNRMEEDDLLNKQLRRMNEVEEALDSLGLLDGSPEIFHQTKPINLD